MGEDENLKVYRMPRGAELSKLEFWAIPKDFFSLNSKGEYCMKDGLSLFTLFYIKHV